MRYKIVERRDGLLLIDKPPGLTSHDVVHSVRKILGTKEVGHCGTLDPLATGLLVLLLGQATKLSDYLLSQNKTYRLRFRLGQRTDTLDATGEILANDKVSVSPEQVTQILLKAQGLLTLPVPAYSAVKIQGRKLYEYARSGQSVESPQREMKFWDLKIIEQQAETVEVELSCSKGSYVRAWTAHVGEILGCGAVLTELRRLRSEPFDVAHALTLPQLEQACEAKSFGSSFVSMSEALPHWRGIQLDSKDERILLNGQISRELFNRLIVEQKQVNELQQALPLRALSLGSGRLLGLLELLPQRGPTIKRIFP